MLRFFVGTMPVRMHVLLPVLWLLALQMGMGSETIALLFALLGHEAAHIAAAKRAGMRIKEMELTPMGAAARMDGLWGTDAARIAVVAMAGPAANAVMIALWMAAAYSSLCAAHTAAGMIRANGLILGINLLPALPLDGGRALWALLGRRMGVTRAVRAGVLCGCTLAAALAGAVLWQGIARGVWNLSLLSAAVYICACALNEMAPAAGASAESFVFRADELRRHGALPVRHIVVPCDITLGSAVGLVRPGGVHVFLLYDNNMRPVDTLEESDLLAAFPAQADRPLCAIAHARRPENAAAVHAKPRNSPVLFKQSAHS